MLSGVIRVCCVERVKIFLYVFVRMCSLMITSALTFVVCRSCCLKHVIVQDVVEVQVTGHLIMTFKIHLNTEAYVW